MPRGLLASFFVADRVLMPGELGFVTSVKALGLGMPQLQSRRSATLKDPVSRASFVSRDRPATIFLMSHTIPLY